MVTLRVTGKRADELFRDEPGGHRWQRVPPNERRGRVQTSTITVAVLPEPAEHDEPLRECDLRWTATRGSGAGGQARNKTSNCVQLWHTPTGTMVRCESERSQAQNLASAKALLRARLHAARTGALTQEQANARRAQVGSGMRGDKRRTIRAQEGQVHDHVTGRRWTLREYTRGDW